MKVTQPKKLIIRDGFEQTFEKVKQVPTINPIEQLSVSKETAKPNNFSSLNFDKLNASYADQDKSQLEALREQMSPEQMKEQGRVQFFKKYKQEEEDYYERRKREKEEEKLQEERAALEKKHMEEEKNLNSHVGEIPKGKVRKNIFGKTNLRANTALPPEIKPGQGKQ